MFRFDDCAFDPATGELSSPRASERLQPKPARLLGMLLDGGGELVAREHIREALWPDTTVDFDAGLNTCVGQIRAALRTAGGATEYIETLPKRGYRFTVPVRHDAPAAGSEPAAAAAPIAGAPPPRAPSALGEAAAVAGGGPQRGSASPPLGRGSSRRRSGLLALSLLAMLAAAAAGWWFGAPSDRPADAAPRARLAILPFDNPGSELDDEFNRALGEAFVVALANADPGTFVVIGPATTAQMMAAGLTPAQIAERTDAGFVLSGGHRETDHSTFVQLIAEPGGEHLFARRFEIDESAPASAPSDVVSAITEAIRQARDPAG